MGHKIHRTPARVKKEQLEKRVSLIRSALKNEATTRAAISKMTGLSLSAIQQTFKSDPELYADFKILRSIIVDQAADNISRIVSDKLHKDHFAASKYVLSHYKSDLDESLEEKEIGGTSVVVGGSPTASPVKVTFKKSK